MEMYFDVTLKVEVVRYEKGILPNKYGWTPPEPEEIELKYTLEIDLGKSILEYEVPLGNDLYEWLNKIYEKKMLNVIKGLE